MKYDFLYSLYYIRIQFALLDHDFYQPDNNSKFCEENSFNFPTEI